MNDKIIKVLAMMENFRMKEDKAGKESNNSKDYCMRVFQAIVAENLLNCSNRADWTEELQRLNLISYEAGTTAEDYNNKYKQLTLENKTE